MDKRNSDTIKGKCLKGWCGIIADVLLRYTTPTFEALTNVVT